MPAPRVPIQCDILLSGKYISDRTSGVSAYDSWIYRLAARVCVQSFDYFETENEDFLRRQSQADPRVSMSEFTTAYLK